MDREQEKIPDSISLSFYKSMGKADFEIVKTEYKEKGIVKITSKCLVCEQVGITKLIAGDNKSCGNFTKHLKNSHPEEHDRFVKQKENLKRPKRDEGPLAKFKTGFTSGKKKLLDKLTLRYIINGMRPLSTVEDPSFRELITGALEDSTVTFMHRKSLKARIMDEYEFSKSAIVKRLEAVAICCLTADLWSSRSRSFLGVTAHWITEALDRESAILACRRFMGTHSYDKIAIELNNVMKDFSIPRTKVVAVVTDNGSNFVKAFKEFGLEFEEERNLEENSDEDEEEEEEDVQQVPIADTMETEPTCKLVYDLPPHLRCVAHTLNLIATTDVKMVLDKGLFYKAVGKCTKLFNLSSSPKSADIIRNVCGKNLKRPVPTRWNSLYDSIKHLMDLEKHLDKLCKEFKLAAFSSKEIDFLKEYIKVSQPLATALDKLQGDSNVYLGELLPTIKGLQSKLRHLKAGLQYTSSFAEALLNGIESRFKNLLELNLLEPSDYVLAAMSHPYFKLRWVPPSQRDALKSAFISKCSELSAKTENSEANQTRGDPPLAHEDDLYEFFDVEDPKSDTKKGVEIECIQYFEDDTEDIVLLKKYPSVEALFRRYNTALPSSASAERLFSSAGLILAPRRNRLSDDIFNTLIFLKCNTKFQI